MPASIGFYSYGAALLAFSALTALALLTQRNRPARLPVLAACGATALWAGVIVASSLSPYPLVKLMQLAEVLRNGAWLFLLLNLFGSRLEGSGHILSSRRWIPWFIVGLIAIALVLLGPRPALLENISSHIDFALWLAMATLVLLLLEQIYRNSQEAERWSIKYLCLGLGVIFAYDFFMYAEALLFKQLDENLWRARGIVTALAAVLMGVSISRIHRRQEPWRLNVSRHVVFHSVTLLAAGIYLILMSLAGYFIRYLGGTWGSVIQIGFLVGSGLLLLALLFSGQIRARTRVWLSKNFFSYKYDYRVEWLEFTQTLAGGGNTIPVNIIQAIAHLAQSPAGLLWHRTEGGQFEFTDAWGMNEPDNTGGLEALPQWLQETEWIIDLKEWRQSPDLYGELTLPQVIADIPRAWLIIPLMFKDQLEGILLLRESELQSELNWEDRDLLKVAGRQAATHLAQYLAHQALIESRQFEAFNRLSAYVIHDLKNILAQQSLLVSNADKHRDNPAFIDDMITTVRNSVERMTRLMEQMRSGVRGKNHQKVALGPLLVEAVDARSKQQPVPTLTGCEGELLIEADREHLATVFSHIIQNAQEAATKTGTVDVRVVRQQNSAIVEIEDDGIGMDEDFLRNRLFKPFDSTKGLTGMGIGAFESREFVRSLGGNIQVSSTPGVGSLFRIVLPCTAGHPESFDTHQEAISE